MASSLLSTRTVTMTAVMLVMAALAERPPDARGETHPYGEPRPARPPFAAEGRVRRGPLVWRDDNASSVAPLVSTRPGADEEPRAIGPADGAVRAGADDDVRLRRADWTAEALDAVRPSGQVRGQDVASVYLPLVGHFLRDEFASPERSDPTPVPTATSEPFVPAPSPEDSPPVTSQLLPLRNAMRFAFNEADKSIWYAPEAAVEDLNDYRFWCAYTLSSPNVRGCYSQTYHFVVRLDLIHQTQTIFGADQGLAVPISAVAADGAGNVWFGSWGMLQRLAPDGTLQDFPLVGAMADRPVIEMEADPSGRIWISSRQFKFQGADSAEPSAGVAVLTPDGPSWTTYDNRNGLESVDVTDFAFDSRGNTWMATFEHGLVVLMRSGEWFQFEAGDGGLAGWTIGPLIVDHKDRVWMVHGVGPTETPCLVQMLDFGGSVDDRADDLWRTFRPMIELKGNFANDIAVDPAGRVWFTFENLELGVQSLDLGADLRSDRDDVWVHHSLPDEAVTQGQGWLALDAAGSAWVAGRVVARLSPDGMQWTTFGTRDALPSAFANAVATDPDGVPWAAFNSHLGKLAADGTMQRVMADNLVLQRSVVNALDFSPGGDLWIGLVANQSAATMHVAADGTVRTFGRDVGLPNRVYELERLPNGTLWFGTRLEYTSPPSSPRRPLA